MERISLYVNPVTWWANIISKTPNWSRVTSHVILLPLSDKAYKEVALELSMQNLTEEVQI
jgi:hypothetical protein